MPRRIERLLAGYAVVAALALAFPHRPAAWFVLLAAHVAVVVSTLHLPPAGAALRAIKGRFPRAARLLADWYPLLLVPLLYAELALLNGAVHGGHYFDALILRWEAVLWGGQPSLTLSVALPQLPLSEVLHACYLSYYLIIYVPAALIYVYRGTAFDEAVFVVMLTFFAHYLFFIYLPVQGPRYLFPAPDGALASGPFYRLAHAVLAAGSSRGAAFPSSHVAVAVVQTVIVARTLPRLAPAMALLTTGLALGAVYGRFHYATDALAGAVTGLLLAWAGRWLWRLPSRRGPRARGRALAQSSQGGATRPAEL